MKKATYAFSLAIAGMLALSSCKKDDSMMAGMDNNTPGTALQVGDQYSYQYNRYSSNGDSSSIKNALTLTIIRNNGNGSYDFSYETKLNFDAMRPNWENQNSQNNDTTRRRTTVSFSIESSGMWTYNNNNNNANNNNNGGGLFGKGGIFGNYNNNNGTNNSNYETRRSMSSTSATLQLAIGRFTDVNTENRNNASNSNDGSQRVYNSQSMGMLQINNYDRNNNRTSSLVLTNHISRSSSSN